MIYCSVQDRISQRFFFANKTHSFLPEFRTKIRGSCGSGDGIGGSEKRVGVDGVAVKFTKEACIDYVKNVYPDANGVTYPKNCDQPDGKCGCYAEMKMSGQNDDDNVNDI